MYSAGVRAPNWEQWSGGRRELQETDLLGP